MKKSSTHSWDPVSAAKLFFFRGEYIEGYARDSHFSLPAGVQPRLIQGIRSGDGVGDLFIYKYLSKI